jgi:hypothetical protein
MTTLVRGKVWKFGDNTTSTSASPTHTFTTVGNYTPILITTSNFGCQDSLARNVYVRPHPATAFSVNNNSQCLRGNLLFIQTILQSVQEHIPVSGNLETILRRSPLRQHIPLYLQEHFRPVW